METRPFGRTGVDVPVIGQGTWKLVDKKKALAALQRGLALGMTHIDTAELYTGSEGVIAPLIADRRDDVFLVSKVLPSHATYEGTLRACDQSLARLGTDHVDVYLLHWWDERRAPKECMRAMGELIDAGKIRWAGVSNFTVPMMEQAMEHLSKKELACNQVYYHLWERGIEVDVLPFCQKNGIAMVGYTPFGPTGQFPGTGTPEGDALIEIGRAHAKTPRQVALRFLTRGEQMFAIPKAEQVPHVEENAGGVGWLLTADELRRLEDAFPAPQEAADLPML